MFHSHKMHTENHQEVGQATGQDRTPTLERQLSSEFGHNLILRSSSSEQIKHEVSNKRKKKDDGKALAIFTNITFGQAARESHVRGYRQKKSGHPTHDEEHEVWHATPVPPGQTTRNTHSITQAADRRVWKTKVMKSLVRGGVPDLYRPAVWSHMVGSRDALYHAPDGYQMTLQSMFDLHLPSKFHHVPTFGGPSFDTLCHTDDLTHQGIICAQRILCVLAMENPDVHVCPILPDLVQLFLHYLHEPEAYVATKLLLLRSKTLRKHPQQSATLFFPVDHKGEKALCHSFDRLVKRFIPTLYAYMKQHKFSVATIIFHKWFLRLFVGAFPMKTVLRIFDIFLLDGLKGLFRVGLVILKSCAPKLTSKPYHAAEFSEFLSSFTHHKVDALQSCPIQTKSLSVPRATIGAMYTRHLRKLVGVQEPSPTVYYRPKNLHTSELIAEDEFERLWTWLPTKLRIRDPKLEFSSAILGRSLRYTLHMIGEFQHTLFIIRSSEDTVFGFFASSSWKHQHHKYFGDRDCFVWTLRPSPAVYRWSNASANDHMQHVDSHSISLGAGPPAVVIHEDYITTNECPTFQNPPLAKDIDFEYARIEIYSVMD